MMSTQDFLQGVVTLEEMFSILVVCEVKPQHVGAETEAPGMEDAMNESMSKVIDGHCSGCKGFHVLGVGEEAPFVFLEEEPRDLFTSGILHSRGVEKMNKPI